MFANSLSLEKVNNIVETFNENMNIEIQTMQRQHFGLVSTGCRLFFPNSQYSLSVQTDSVTAGTAFCETALFFNNGLIYDESFGYRDVIRHDKMEDFETHLKELFALLETHKKAQIPFFFI
jgi:hypothetical protein